MASLAIPSNAAAPREAVWLFSRGVDLWTFGGSAALSLLLLAVGGWAGVLYEDAPEWTWVSAVLLVDVAHVYATGFRVYFDRAELRRRPGLYWGTPLAVFIIGWALASESTGMFWRVLAYLAVFHFVRQQYGWVALYRVKAGERGRLGRWVDTASIYLATVYPLVYWHCHLPRRFWWFLHGDFVALPSLAADALAPVYWVVMASYFTRSLVRGVREQQWNPGKDLVVATTAVCWYVGIITFNSDYAFTVTNVIIHGIPYMVLVYWYREQSRRRAPRNEAEEIRSLGSGDAFSREAHHAERDGYSGRDGDSGHGPSLVTFLATIWVLAYAEELLWDRGLWHEHGWLFGRSWETAGWQPLLIALLAVPQVTHYVLDGFIWKRRSNRTFAETIAP